MVFTYHTASTDMSTYLPQFVNNYWPCDLRDKLSLIVQQSPPASLTKN